MHMSYSYKYLIKGVMMMNTNACPLFKQTEEYTLATSDQIKINEFIKKALSPTVQKLSDHSQNISDHNRELSEELMEMIQIDKELKIKEMLASNKKVELLNFERRLKEQSSMKIDLHNLLECYLIILKSNEELLNQKIHDLKMKETYLNQKEIILSKIISCDTITTEKIKWDVVESRRSLNKVSHHGFSIESNSTKLLKPKIKSRGTTQVKDQPRLMKVDHIFPLPTLRKFLTPKVNHNNPTVSKEKRNSEKLKGGHLNFHQTSTCRDQPLLTSRSCGERTNRSADKIKGNVKEYKKHDKNDTVK